MVSKFPTADWETLRMWYDECMFGDRSIANLNALHLAASIWYAKLSTYVMETNAGRMDDDAA